MLGSCEISSNGRSRLCNVSSNETGHEVRKHILIDVVLFVLPQVEVDPVLLCNLRHVLFLFFFFHRLVPCHPDSSNLAFRAATFRVVLEDVLDHVASQADSELETRPTAQTLQGLLQVPCALSNEFGSVGSSPPYFGKFATRFWVRRLV
jgi:hypothetical protein